MVLDELHVLQRGARPISERHAVAGLDVSVRREGEDAAAAARAQDYGFRGDRLNLSCGEFDGNHALNAAIVDQQSGDKELVISGDCVVLERGLKQGVEQMKAGPVGGKPCSGFLHSAKRTNGDVPVRLAAP